MQELVVLNAQAPAKGIEMSIVRRKFCAPFVYPTPFELHFSAMHLNWFRENPGDYVDTSFIPPYAISPYIIVFILLASSEKTTVSQ